MHTIEANGQIKADGSNINMKYSLKKSDKDSIIKDISVYLREKYIEITAAYIFGSFI